MPERSLARAARRGLCLSVALASGVLAHAQDTGAGRFVADSVLHDGHWFPYSVYLPPGYTADRTWPTVLVLHGDGSRGEDGLRQRGQSIVEAALHDTGRWPAILVLPQCPQGDHWLGRAGRAAEAALSEVSARYAVDRSRIYLAGQSMGADGVFALAGRRPQQYAAIVAVAVGRGNPAFRPEELLDIPVRVFHGTIDRIPVARARSRVARLRAAGHTDAVLREYPGRGHDIFDDVYRDATLSRWLFAQARHPRRR